MTPGDVHDTPLLLAVHATVDAIEVGFGDDYTGLGSRTGACFKA